MGARLLLPFGLREGELLPATAVANGLACHCTCPGCGARLVARNGGTRKVAHFAHDRAPECAHGLQTALHLLAKQVFLQARHVQLPGASGEVDFSAEYLASFPFPAARFRYHLPIDILEDETSYDIPARYVPFTDVVLERRTGGVVPDVVLQTARGELLVEIAVTHFVDEEKRRKLTELGLPTVEIDLSGVSRDLAQADLTHLLVHETTHKRWVHNAALAARIRQQQATYEERARPHFQHLYEVARREQRERLREQQFRELLAAARARQIKPIMQWRIRQQHTLNQILSCPRQVRQQAGTFYANVEADCTRCRYFAGRVGEQFINCRGEVAPLCDKGVKGLPLPEWEPGPDWYTG